MEQKDWIHRECETLLRRADAVEARAWILSGQDDPEATRSISGGSGSKDALANEHALAWVEGIYAAGAERVVAVDIEGYEAADCFQDTATLVIVLPEEPEKRQTLLRHWNSFARAMNWAEEPEVGQQFLLVYFS